MGKLSGLILFLLAACFMIIIFTNFGGQLFTTYDTPFNDTISGLNSTDAILDDIEGLQNKSQEITGSGGLSDIWAATQTGMSALNLVWSSFVNFGNFITEALGLWKVPEIILDLILGAIVVLIIFAILSAVFKIEL